MIPRAAASWLGWIMRLVLLARWGLEPVRLVGRYCSGAQRCLGSGALDGGSDVHWPLALAVYFFGEPVLADDLAGSEWKTPGARGAGRSDDRKAKARRWCRRAKVGRFGVLPWREEAQSKV